VDHVFIYVRPFSLESKNSSIAEISCVRTNGQVGQTTKRNVIAAFSTKIDDEYSFKNAVTNIKKNVVGDSDKFVVVTYLSDYVHTLVRNECRKIEVEELFLGRSWIDVAQLAWPLVSNGMIESRTIEVLSKHFGIKLLDKEDTADICTAIVGVYGYMMRRYKTALAGEEVIRDIGGETLDSIRKMVGF